MATEAQRRASAKYDKENAKGYYFKLNKKEDSELIACLDAETNRQTLFKKFFANYYGIKKDY